MCEIPQSCHKQFRLLLFLLKEMYNTNSKLFHFKHCTSSMKILIVFRSFVFYPRYFWYICSVPPLPDFLFSFAVLCCYFWNLTVLRCRNMRERHVLYFTGFLKSHFEIFSLEKPLPLKLLLWSFSSFWKKPVSCLFSEETLEWWLKYILSC